MAASSTDADADADVDVDADGENKRQFNGDEPADGSSGNVGDDESTTDRTSAAADEKNAEDVGSNVSETEANDTKGVVD